MRRLIIHLWILLDPLYFSCTRLQCLERVTGNYNIFRIRLTRYKGKDVMLSDGTFIKKHDLLIKIHLHNVRLLKEMMDIDDQIKKAIYVYKKVYESMPDLANYLLHHKHSIRIKGIIGITMLDKGYRRIGFEAIPCTSRIYIWFKGISQYPIHFLFRPPSVNKKALPPHYLFMSKYMILKKYAVDIENIAYSRGEAGLEQRGF